MVLSQCGFSSHNIGLMLLFNSYSKLSHVEATCVFWDIDMNTGLLKVCLLPSPLPTPQATSQQKFYCELDLCCPPPPTTTLCI